MKQFSQVDVAILCADALLFCMLSYFNSLLHWPARLGIINGVECSDMIALGDFIFTFRQSFILRNMYSHSMSNTCVVFDKLCPIAIVRGHQEGEIQPSIQCLLLQGGGTKLSTALTRCNFILC